MISFAAFYSSSAIDKTYSFRLIFWDFMASLCDENVRPVTLLMNDSCKLLRIIVPRSRWLARETLYATKSRVLKVSNLSWPFLWARRTTVYLDGNYREITTQLLYMHGPGKSRYVLSLLKCGQTESSFPR